MLSCAKLLVLRDASECCKYSPFNVDLKSAMVFMTATRRPRNGLNPMRLKSSELVGVDECEVDPPAVT